MKIIHEPLYQLTWKEDYVKIFEDRFKTIRGITDSGHAYYIADIKGAEDALRARLKLFTYPIIPMRKENAALIEHLDLFLRVQRPELTRYTGWACVLCNGKTRKLSYPLAKKGKLPHLDSTDFSIGLKQGTTGMQKQLKQIVQGYQAQAAEAARILSDLAASKEDVYAKLDKTNEKNATEGDINEALEALKQRLAKRNKLQELGYNAIQNLRAIQTLEGHIRTLEQKTPLETQTV